MNAKTCICQKVLKTSIAALQCMSGEALEQYWLELKEQQACRYPKTLNSEIQRCEETLYEKAVAGDKCALKWKLETTRPAKGLKTKTCKI